MCLIRVKYFLSQSQCYLLKIRNVYLYPDFWLAKSKAKSFHEKFYTSEAEMYLAIGLKR